MINIPGGLSLAFSCDSAALAVAEVIKLYIVMTFANSQYKLFLQMQKNTHAGQCFVHS